MGQGNSTHTISKRDYTKHKERFQSINSELTVERNKTSSLADALKNERESTRLLRSKLDQLSSVCMVDRQNINLSKNDLEMTGRKIYGLLSKKYKENIHILETQQSLMDRQNRLVGLKDVKLTEQKNKVRDLNRRIQKNDRMLMYDNEDYSVQNRVINILKITSTICIIVLIIYVAIMGFLKLKSS